MEKNYVAKELSSHTFCIIKFAKKT